MSRLTTTLQNTTFGGIQGFTRRPATPWFDDDGNQAGIVHQERNWTYVLVQGAGHLVPYNSPERVRIPCSCSCTPAITNVGRASSQGFVLAREFIFGSNTTGLVTDSSVAAVGGEDPALAVDALRGQDGIYLGSISTTSTFVYPSATIAAWNSFIATAVPTPTDTSGGGAANGSASGGGASQTQGSGGGGPVEAVWWIEETGTQWRVKGRAFIVADDIEGSNESSGVRTVKSEVGKRMRVVNQANEGQWSWARELTGTFGNQSPGIKGKLCISQRMAFYI